MPIIDYTPHQSRIRPKETLKSETNRVVRSLIITLAAMIMVLSVIFISATSQGAQKGYTLKEVQLKNNSLKTEKDILTSKITDSTAFNKIQDNKNVEKMAPTEIKNYITKEDNKVN